mgnify:CR=1 FL=1
MKTIFGYLKGIYLLLLLIGLIFLVVVFIIAFNIVYAIVLAILLIVALFILPYYVGRKQVPEKKGEYKVDDIKE